MKSFFRRCCSSSVSSVHVDELIDVLYNSSIEYELFLALLSLYIKHITHCLTVLKMENT